MREFYKAKREIVRSAQKDKQIAEAFLSSPFAHYGSFFVYLSFGTEAATDGLIASLQERGKLVCVPRLSGKEMSSVPLRKPLKRNTLGVLQPESGEETTCEVALTPLLAVDRDGFRLGYGGGYYDRYFSAHPDVLRVGLCFAGQAVARLPREETDVPLDAVITEYGATVYGRNDRVGDRLTGRRETDIIERKLSEEIE